VTTSANFKPRSGAWGEKRSAKSIVPSTTSARDADTRWSVRAIPRAFSDDWRDDMSSTVER
jgi:hypothetical protein